MVPDLLKGDGQMFNNYALLAAVTAAVGVMPLLLKRRFLPAAILGFGTFWITWGLYYAFVPSTIWPIFGFPGFCVALVWICAAVIDGSMDESPTWIAIFPAGYILVLLVTGIMGWSFFNASTYATFMGHIEERDWTKDVQPKDPKHMRMVSDSTALYIAQKAVANAGAIGSQFQLDSGRMTLQRVNNELVYIIPFDFAGFSKWTESEGVPAYIIVYAEDPERQPRLVKLEDKNLMHFSPGAWFSANLERYLRQNGFVNDGLARFRFELDEDGQAHWVITTYKPTLQWWGEEVTGVATVNPSTGEIARYTVAEAPVWIDRVYPGSFVRNYANWWGEYTGGWLNSWWGSKDLTQTEVPQLIYAEGEKSEWVIGITSTGANDDSLVGLLYVDSRTGKAVYYRTNGGATDEAILEAVNNNQSVLFKKLTGTAPQIYNVYGTMAAVVPLVNPSNAFQGVAIVPINNVQDVAVGESQSQALRVYQSNIYRTGQQITLGIEQDIKELTGIVDRIGQDFGSNGSVYRFTITGAPRIFNASGGEYVKLGLTRSGDTVVVKYVASGESEVPIQSFDNLTLQLDKTSMQQEVELAASARMKNEQATDAAEELVKKITNMTPEQLLELQEKLKN